MKTVASYLESKQDEFKTHSFFTLLQELKELKQISYFVPELTFWVMTFQDILRINEERIKEPYLKKIAKHHRLEDAGHHRWFMQDKQYMADSLQDPSWLHHDINWLFSRETQSTRDAAYAIMSEVYQTEDELLNIALLLTLESSGHIFFDKVAEQVKAAGEDAQLKYFSSTHLEVERAHALFEEEMERELFTHTLPMPLRRLAIQMIDRCYDNFHKMFDGLTQTCKKRLEKAPNENRKHEILPEKA